MKVSIKKEISLEALAAQVQLNPTLIKASNPKLDFKIEKNEAIFMPSYQFIGYKRKKTDTLAEICDKFKIKEEIISLFNDLDDEAEKIIIPKRIKHHIIDDVNHYSYGKMIKQINQLTELYPFIKKKIIGYSVLNRPIIELRIGRGSYHTHFNASFHANEWITSALLMKSLNEYARLLTEENADQSLINIFKTTTVSVVPMVNPDGVDLVIKGLEGAGDYADHVYLMNERSADFSRWKANILGVDLNKQFPAKWGFEKSRLANMPTYRDYPGDFPLSQLESLTMAALTMKNNFHRVHALHTQGEEIYWGFDKLEPEIAYNIASHYARVMNYEAVRHVDNYAGYKDWFIKKFRRPGFTIELGKGTNPLPIEQFNYMYDALLSLFLTNLLLTI